MKISLFGASGKTGVEVVNQSLELGTNVRAFVRDASKIKKDYQNVKIYIGDVMAPESLGDVNSGVDVAVITLGGILASGIKNIIEDLKKNDVKKVILMSSYPMCGSKEGFAYLKSADMNEAKITDMMPMIEDKKIQEQIVMESGLDWIIVRPTFLNDSPKSGRYTIGDEKIEFNATKNFISRADVADFIIKAVYSETWDRKIVSISS